MRFMCCSLSAGGVRRSAADSPDWKFGLIRTVVTRTSSLTSFAGHTGTRGIPGTATPRVNRGDSSIPNPGRSSPRPRRSATVYLDFRRSITMLTCSPNVLGLSLSSGDPLQRHPNGVVNRTLGGLPCGCMFPRLDDVDSTTPPGPSRWPVLPQAPNSEPRVCMDSVARARERAFPRMGGGPRLGCLTISSSRPGRVARCLNHGRTVGLSRLGGSPGSVLASLSAGA